MRSKRLWIVIAVALVLIVGLLVWRPWRQPDISAPPPVQAAAQPKAPSGAYEAQRSQAETAARNGLDAEAISVLAETDTAIAKIVAGDRTAAIAALERAAGKAQILVGRNPANALIPASAEVEVVDAAPADPGVVDALRRSLESAVEGDDLPRARAILDTLRSEIRVRTYHIPLVSYPTALASAASLLEQQKLPEAAELLNTARSTLVITDVITPLPLLVAQSALDAAKADADRQKKLQHLAVARAALERSQALGYADRDTRKALVADIRSIETQAKGGSEVESTLGSLQTRLASVIAKLKGESKSGQP